MKLEDAESPFLTFEEQASDPTTPAAGLWIGYFKAGGLYARDDAGTVVGPLGAGGSVATDAIFDAKGDLPVGTGANTAAKLTAGTNGYVLTADSGETTGLKWAAASGGAAVPKVVTATRTAGNLSPNNASWTDLSTSLDVTIAAATGDLIEYSPSLYLSGIGGSIGFDVATIVSSTRTNYFGSAPGASAFGVSGWLVATANGIAGSHFYTVQAGDISGGNVLFRIIYRGGAATVSAVSDIPAKIQVINHGTHT